MTISELILMLKEIEKDHGDISVKRPYLMDKYQYQDYLDFDIEKADIKIYYSHLSVSGVAWYEIELAEEEE